MTRLLTLEPYMIRRDLCNLVCDLHAAGISGERAMSFALNQCIDKCTAADRTTIQSLMCWVKGRLRRWSSLSFLHRQCALLQPI